MPEVARTQQRNVAQSGARFAAPALLAFGAVIFAVLSAPPVQATMCPAGMTPVEDLANVCEREFTANGTFTVPSSALLIEVLIVGGGGGGGGGSDPPLAATGTGGGGGGAGGVEIFTPDVIAGATYRITIGTGGGAGLPGVNGGPGGTTTVNFGLNKIGLEIEQSVQGGSGGLAGSRGTAGGAGGASGSGQAGGTVEVSNRGGGGGGGGSGGPGNANGSPFPPPFASNAGANGGEPTPVIGNLFNLPTGDPYGWGGGGGAGYETPPFTADGGIGRPGFLGSGHGGDSYNFVTRVADQPQDGSPGINAGGGGGGGAYSRAGGAGADGVVVIRIRVPAVDDPAQAPPPIIQQVGLLPGHRCSDLDIPSLNWAGVGSGGWGQSWADWAVPFTGGAVCTRELFYDSPRSRWAVRI